MIVKDVEDGLSNFPEDVEILFECDGKQVFLQSIGHMANTVDPEWPSQIVLVRFTKS